VRGVEACRASCRLGKALKPKRCSIYINDIEPAEEVIMEEADHSFYSEVYNVKVDSRFLYFLCYFPPLFFSKTFLLNLMRFQVFLKHH
jgi:hypothetical protein